MKQEQESFLNINHYRLLILLTRVLTKNIYLARTFKYLLLLILASDF